jgi:hypothetical protein
VGPGLSDTDPEAARVQMDLLRAASPARRLQMAWSLSAQVIGLARLALQRNNPGMSRDEAALRFVELYYGSDLADGVRQRLAARRS